MEKTDNLYESPKLEIIHFDAVDIIVTSGEPEPPEEEPE